MTTCVWDRAWVPPRQKAALYTIYSLKLKMYGLWGPMALGGECNGNVTDLK